MRILLITPIRFWGGGEGFMLDLGKGLAGRGHEVLLIAHPGSSIAERGTEAGLDVETIPLRGELDPRTLLAVRRLVEKRSPDIALVNMDKPIRILALAGALKNLPAVRWLGMNTPFPDAWRFRFTYRRLVTRLVVNARGTAEVLRRVNPWIPQEKIVVIPSAVDVDALDAIDRTEARSALRGMLAIEDDRPVVVGVGRLAKQKRPEVFVEALRIMGGSAPHAVWIGKGALQEEVARLAAEAGVELHLTGFRRDATFLLAGADLLVQPSQSEGMPHTVVEAMALGIPVVGTSISGVVELLEEGRGRMVPVGDAAALAGAIAAALEETDETARRTAAARRLVDRDHTYTRMLDRYESLFDEIVTQRGETT